MLVAIISLFGHLGQMVVDVGADPARLPEAKFSRHLASHRVVALMKRITRPAAWWRDPLPDHDLDDILVFVTLLPYRFACTGAGIYDGVYTMGVGYANEEIVNSPGGVLCYSGPGFATFKQAGMIFEGDRPLRRNYAELGAMQ